MRNWTYLEAKTKVERDLDLEEENIIQPEEMVSYFNEAIDVAEADIHKLGLEDEYFLASDQLALVNGTADYSLPTDIYANKLRAVMYQNGATIYEIKRVRERPGQRRFETIAQINYSGGDCDYEYIIKNASAALGPQMQLVPPSREDSTTNVTRWYVRNANRIPQVGEAKPTSGNYTQAEVDATVLDIPEFMSFVLQYVKNECKKKEGVLTDGDRQELLAQRNLMIDTLTEMVPDGDDEIPADFSHYEEMN
jgi:hypothetical protein